MKRRTAFLIGIAFELIAVFCIFLPPLMLRASGVAITLETIPVDPYSVFRGQYVTLDYVVGRDVPQAELNGAPVYVVLAPRGDIYERVSFTTEKPVPGTGQVCLRGKLDWTGIHFPDIGQYFVEEGQGEAIADAQRTHHLLVDAKVNSNCDAVIDGIRIGTELTQDELVQRNGLPPGVVETVPAAKPVAPSR